jgi:hypothetical protein
MVVLRIAKNTAHPRPQRKVLAAQYGPRQLHLVKRHVEIRPEEFKYYKSAKLYGISLEGQLLLARTCRRSSIRSALRTITIERQSEFEL